MKINLCLTRDSMLPVIQNQTDLNAAGLKYLGVIRFALSYHTRRSIRGLHIRALAHAGLMSVTQTHPEAVLSGTVHLFPNHPLRYA